VTPSMRRPGMLAGLAAMVALSGAMGPPSGGANNPSPSREFVAPARQGKRRRKKQLAKKDDPPTKKWPGRMSRAARRVFAKDRFTGSQKWQHFKDGSAIDGRGDYRSAKRLRRQRISARYGLTSSRRWVRFRRYAARLVRSAKHTVAS
jgi:hypothetical protein